MSQSLHKSGQFGLRYIMTKEIIDSWGSQSLHKSGQFGHEKEKIQGESRRVSQSLHKSGQFGHQTLT